MTQKYAIALSMENINRLKHSIGNVEFNDAGIKYRIRDTMLDALDNLYAYLKQIGGEE